MMVLEETLEFKGIQTSQVLEAYKELSKSVTFELIWISWHIPVKNRFNVLKIQYNEHINLFSEDPKHPHLHILNN